MAQGHCPAHTPYLAGCPDCQRINRERKAAWKERTGRALGYRVPDGLPRITPKVSIHGTWRGFDVDAAIARAADAMFTTVDDHRQHRSTTNP